MEKLKECKCRSENGNCIMIGGFCTSIPQNYCEMAKELKSLREKQTPMKVKERKIIKDMYGHPYTIRGNCPVCGSAGLLASNTDYCNACGQKLKWD